MPWSKRKPGSLRRWPGSLVRLSLVALLLSGCAGLWDRLNADGARQALQAALAAKGITATDLSCHMIGSTRSFSCRGQLDPATRERLIAGFGLMSSPKTSPESSFESSSGGCRADGLPLVLSSPQRRAPELKGLEYLMLFYDPASGRSCLQSSHSYG